MKKKKKKYNFGTGVNNSSIKNYLPSPGEELAQNNINIAEAQFEANTNPLYLGLKTLGNLTMQAGSAMGGTGLPQADGLIMNLGNTEFAMGGITGSQEIEAEGGEVVETPNGNIKELKGPKHEQGGIDLVLPDGTEIFSERVSVDGKSMANRKKKRERKRKKLSDMLDKNPTDKVLKDTYERGVKSIDKEENQDLMIQQAINNIMKGDKSKAAFGIDRPDMFSNFGDKTVTSTGNTILPQQKGSVGSQSKPNNTTSGLNGSSISGGDALGIFGNMFSTFAPLINTLKNRAKDTPNKNFFKDFGRDALDDIQKAQSFIGQQQDNALSDINLSSNSARRRARNSARGINTQRALDLGIEQQANRAKNDVYDNFARQMMQLLSQEASLENQQDSVVMQGEQARDLADRQDKDNFNTQLAKNLSTIGQGIQTTGRDINQIQQNDTIMNLLNELFKSGSITSKGNIQ